MAVTQPQQTIEIAPYQERWVAEFQVTGAKLRRALGDLALRIDHIGSTSVPGLCAKDIVDIQVTVESLDPDEPLTTAVTSAGYRVLHEFSQDHRPPGDDSPDREWQKRFVREREGERRTHIHVRVAGSANQRYAILFRDYLRANILAMLAYERIKKELARLHPHDIDAYYDIKDPVCDLIMNAAEAWASSSGWHQGPSDA